MNAPNAGAAGAVLMALAISWLWPAECCAPTVTTAAAVITPAAVDAAPAAAPATVELPPRAAPAAAEAEPSQRLQLPDGTSVPTLNGAIDAAPLQQYWGNWPWSPIVGVVRGAGVDWYQHADGSCSTTQMVWRSDLGRHAAMTRVAHPGPAPAAPAIAQR